MDKLKQSILFDWNFHWQISKWIGKGNATELDLHSTETRRKYSIDTGIKVEVPWFSITLLFVCDILCRNANHILKLKVQRMNAHNIMKCHFVTSTIGLLVNGCINVVITTIEKRFCLRSSQTGLVASGYDIASFVCLVPVTYFGGRAGASKPRWIGVGMAVMGIGSLVFSLPHFLVGAYRATNADASICLHENSTSTVSVRRRRRLSLWKVKPFASTFTKAMIMDAT